MLDVGKVLIGRDQIAARVSEIGKQISADYKGKDIVLVGILRGAILFLADLLRSVSIPVAVDFMAVSSYGAATKSSASSTTCSRASRSSSRSTSSASRAQV